MAEMAPVNLFHELVEPVSKDGLMNRLTDSVVQGDSGGGDDVYLCLGKLTKEHQGQHNGCRKGSHIDGCS
jgi:hypothetical protein